jgi:hypothetical protein
MFTIQYKVFTNLRNPSSKSIIGKTWAENPNHGLKTVRRKTVENSATKKNWGLHPQTTGSALWIWFRCANAPKPTGGGLVGYPPLAQVHRTCKLVKLHAKNITHTQQKGHMGFNRMHKELCSVCFKQVVFGITCISALVGVLLVRKFTVMASRCRGRGDVDRNSGELQRLIAEKIQQAQDIQIQLIS